MELRLFGEVQLRAEGRLLDVGTPRQQAVLAALAVDAGRPVAITTLIDRVWGETSPVEIRNVLYSHLSRIRQVLKRAGVVAPIDRRSAGYVLDIDPELVDLHRFTRLVRQGNDSGRSDEGRAAALTEALGLWRGPPLAGIPGDWADRVRDSWHRRRLDVVLQRGELELKLGRGDTVIAAFPDLLAEYPLAEPLEALLMRALHAAGRDAEAVERYAVFRGRLADELGTDPGPELRALHGALLRDELPARDHTGALATPAQLPPDVYGFAGREDELRQLDGMVADRPAAARIVTVSGTAGVGKTSLIVHWAHRVRGEFPDGQLYVNLRGFNPTGSPVSPTDAVRGFLDAFEVTPDRIPTGLDAQTGLYRSLLATRRVLVVLDNARDAEQVRPLLPGAPGCHAIVASRNQLSGLVAEGAHPLTLNLLDDTQARELLDRRLGADRVAAEPRAVEEIVRLCARLPLALAVVAARAATHPDFGLDVLADELRAARGGLDEFAGADPATDPRAVFSWSYLQLRPETARLFRLLGLHPGPDIATRAMASLGGIPLAAVRPRLAELAGAHLVAEPRPGRYTCHDLLRAYANEQAGALDTEADRQAAIERLLGHYLYSADAADRLLNPNRDEPSAPPPPLPPGVNPERLADPARALAWFDAERRVLLAVIRQVSGFDAQIWQLGWALKRYLDYQGHWHDLIGALGAALQAARRLRDPRRQGFAHCFLGCTYLRFGRYDEARTQFENSLDLYQGADDAVGMAYVHHYYSWLLERQDRSFEALLRAQQALELFRSAEHRGGQAKVLNAIGWYHALLGDYPAALTYCRQALELQTELGDLLGQAETWDSLGYAHTHLGQHRRAVACYESAAQLYQQFGYRYNEADVLSALGDAHHAAGNLESAAAAWQLALAVLDQLRHPDADEVRAKLKTMTGGNQ